MNKLFLGLGKLCLGIVAGVVAALWNGWVLQLLWEWFIVAEVGTWLGVTIPLMSMAVAISLAIFRQIAAPGDVSTGIYVVLMAEKTGLDEKIRKAIPYMSMYFTPMFALIAGSLWHFILWPLLGF